MKMHKLFIWMGIFISTLAITSCEKESTGSYTDYPIIEGFLKADSVFSITIARQIPFDESVTFSSDDIDNLSVVLELNNETSLLHPMGDGLYVDSTIVITEGDNYSLSFQFDDREVTAYTYVPSKPIDFIQSATEMYIEKVEIGTGPPAGGITQPDPIELNWTNTDESYYLVLVENLESTLDPIRDFGGNTPPGNRFRKQPTNSSFEDLQAREFQYFGMHRIILYHVLPDYATLYDENSTSSQNITNPSTSISNGYGIFTGLNTDTLYVEVIES
jgi:hypothetical protein